MSVEVQFDHKVRVVSFANLRALCVRASGICHRYVITRTTKTRVEVTYSNPDEWGHEHPMTAVFPLIPVYGDTGVLLQILRVKHDNWHGEGWQAFDLIVDGPVLWRNPDGDTWHTEEEIKAAKGDADA